MLESVWTNMKSGFLDPKPEFCLKPSMFHVIEPYAITFSTLMLNVQASHYHVYGHAGLVSDYCSNNLLACVLFLELSQYIHVYYYRVLAESLCASVYYFIFCLFSNLLTYYLVVRNSRPWKSLYVW